MAEVVKTLLNGMGTLGMTLGFTVDNAGDYRTMLKQLEDDPGVKLSPDTYFRCFALALNLVVQNTTKSIKASITTIRDTAHATRYSPRKLNHLEDYCKANKDGNDQSAPIKLFKPVVDVKMRWNLTYDMLD